MFTRCFGEFSALGVSSTEHRPPSTEATLFPQMVDASCGLRRPGPVHGNGSDGAAVGAADLAVLLPVLLPVLLVTYVLQLRV